MNPFMGFQAGLRRLCMKGRIAATVGHSDRRPLMKEVPLKVLLATLAAASLLAAPLAASAQARQGGGGFHGGGGAAASGGGGFHGGGGNSGGGVGRPGGGYGHGAGGWSGNGGGHSYNGGRYYGRGGYGRYGGYRSYPYYFGGGVGLGFALGLSAGAPWYYDAPYYGYYYPRYTYYDDGGPAPDGYVVDQAPPPAANQAPAACGSWSWDPARETYTWIPC
jgi:hypothetical protein